MIPHATILERSPQPGGAGEASGAHRARRGGALVAGGRWRALRGDHWTYQGAAEPLGGTRGSKWHLSFFDFFF